jgi:DNA-directed RNA polymerase subunit F
MSANENITRLIGEINAELDTQEAAASWAPEIKVAERKMKAAETALDDLSSLGTFDTVHDALSEAIAKVASMLPVKSDDMKERLSMAQKALDAADLLPDVPVDDLEAVLARAEAVYAAKPSAATGKAQNVRGIGTPIHVECDCGDFVRESKTGDWTSIRYQAKTHADECSKANPDESGEYLNHFDHARDAIVTKRQANFRTGGLVFSLPEHGSYTETHAAGIAGE